MCKFFSLVSDGTGKIYYLNAEQREATKGKYESPDSHTYIADYYGFKGSKEDKLNKYEYNPLTKVLTADQINTTDDRISVGQKCKRLNFKTIVPQLIIHPIFNPVKSKRCKKVVESDLDLLARWDSVGGSVWGSVGDSVGDSVEASVGDSGYGQHDANWLAFYEYFKEVCGLDDITQKLTGIWQISKNAGWWLPYQHICWIDSVCVDFCQLHWF